VGTIQANGTYSYKLKIIQANWELFMQTGNYWPIGNLFRQTRNYSGKLRIIQVKCELSRPTGNYSGKLELFRQIQENWEIIQLSRYYSDPLGSIYSHFEPVRPTVIYFHWEVFPSTCCGIIMTNSPLPPPPPEEKIL
jgi:hypothetical protein